MDTPPTQPPLLDLLQKASLGRRKKIQATWSAPDHSPEVLYTSLTGDPEAFLTKIKTLPEREDIKTLMLDMVQEFNLPVTLFPEDQTARELLASWGLIYPFPASWAVRDLSLIHI